jgi:23S rRNA pseudouridine1911/1915/1917 synthase
MKRHEFGKEYIAIVRGRPSTEAGAIELPISRVPGSIMLRGVDCSGKWAKTYFTVIASSLQWSLVKLYPVTGRTHQIRVHMAAIGCPLLADSLYGPESAAGAAGSDETAGGTPGAAGASGSTDAATAAVAAVADETAGMPAAMRRQALHAWRISFAHPYSNLQITIKAPPPQDFLRAAAHLLCYALL